MCINAEREVSRLFNWLSIGMDRKVFSKMKIPSAVSEKHSAIITGDNLINKWKKDLSKTDINRAIYILKMFGLDSIYNENPEPKEFNVSDF